MEAEGRLKTAAIVSGTGNLVTEFDTIMLDLSNLSQQMSDSARGHGHE